MKIWFTLVAAFFMMLAMTIVSGCNGDETLKTITTPTIRLYSEYSQGGLDSMEISRVNGPYYLYGAPQNVIAVANDPEVKIQMVGPNNDVSTTTSSRMDVDLSLGTYYFRAIKNGVAVSEDVRLDVIDLGQKPVIEVYVETRRSAANAPGDITIVSCLIKNTDTRSHEIGATINNVGDRVDCEVASNTFTFGGNQGQLNPNQTYWPGKSTLWRSTTNTTVDINDDVNVDQFLTTLAPGESIRLISWFKTN